ncbi:MAG: response regulator [Pirellulales bacterium]|nr:response regulator [Pirellulales bacterium]
METRGGRPAEVLLVEDSEDDVFLTRKTFENAKLAVNLHHVENGKKCMSFLRKEGKYADAPTPDLILLDLNMPVMDGREVLAEIVQDDKLRKLCVVILTTSDSESDLLDMYNLRCSSYITKPVDFVQFQRVIEEISNYWFTVVVLPPADH